MVHIVLARKWIGVTDGVKKYLYIFVILATNSWRLGICSFKLYIMRIKKIVFIIFILILFQGCDMIIKIKLYVRINNESDEIFINRNATTKSYNITEFNQQGRLFFLAKIWGKIKYRAISNNSNLNEVLIETIPKIITANNISSFNNELIVFLNKTIEKEQLNCFENSALENRDVATKSWIENPLYFSNETKKFLNILTSEKLLNKSSFIEQNSFGNIKIVNNLKHNDLFPEIPNRLYGLFDYWNVIDNFYVHKEIMNNQWDSVLYNTIPNFINCKDSIEYNKAILKLTSLLNDTHVYTSSEIIDNVIFGRNIPPFTLYRYDDRFYVDELYLKDFNTLQVGDEIKAINNIHIFHLYDSIKIYKGSSIDSKNGKVGWFIYSTPKDNISVSFIRQGIEKSVNIECKNYKIITSEKTQHKIEKTQNYRIEKVKNGVSYFHVRYLTKKNVTKIIDDIGKNDTLIFDLRGYPEYGVSFRLIDFFISKGSRFVSIAYPDIYNPGIIRLSKGNKYWKLRDTFEGLLIILVDGNTMSEAEYLTMALQKAKNAITVGSTTVGADGNVVYYTFPGNVHTSFTGIGIFYPDMTPTQRVGVKIDHYVEPTLADIIKGRDPVLEFVVDSLLGK